ncbi:hypothetical protein L3X38_021484 [Prunus dulcis]|uniref:Uncharacterized protein n=1 Tax=Prunus dulcis TaxID=3755 RepID=A0AAD4Z498_PRUDU|nr:hypothetical protein L3X38_021484 [Prunus dulcis]
MSSSIVLALYENDFIGNLPDNICEHLPSIQRLGLGEIPDEIGDLHNLQGLALHVNNLNGVIPSRIFNLSMIKFISLFSNQLSGSLPADIGTGVPDLQQLLVGDNKLSGTIPTNSFFGFIPMTLRAFTNLQWLNLQWNNLTIDASIPRFN